MNEDERYETADRFSPEAAAPEWYRELFLRNVAGVVCTTLDGEILEVNRSLARILGIDDPSTLKGEDIVAFYRSPEDRKRIVEKLYSEERVENAEFPIRRPDGSTGVVLTNAHLVRQQVHDEPVIWATVIDITKRKRAEEVLRHFESLVEHSEDAIIAKSLDGRIETWNAAAERMYGWTAEEAIGEPATILVPEDVEAEFEELLEAVAGGELVQSCEIDRVKQDGTRFPISLTLSPIRGEEGELIGISGIDRDITELRRHRRKLEELVRERTRELEEREAALRRAEKLEAIGKLTGGVAHDFNNLLQVIDANLQFLRRNLAGSGEARQRIATASEAVEQGAELTSQLLGFARRQPLEPRVVEPGRLLEKVDGIIRRTLDESIEVETHVEDGLWNTVVDPHRLESVLLNLVVNARDAMEGEGRLTIELENIHLVEDYPAERAELTPGRYVCLSVSDTGRGMTEEDQKRAFEPFFTTKGEEGTGLGLSMAYGFAKQSGGHIGIYSEPGEGTTVRLYLPHTSEAEERVEEQPDAAAPPAAEGGDETVLVVEDHDDVRVTAVEMLKDLGYRVLEAADGESALAVLKSGAEIDLLFTDVVMPGPVRSTDLAQQARALFPDLEVLFTSGYTENAIVHQGRLDPGVKLLDKPYGQEKLARAVRRVLGGSDGPAPEIRSAQGGTPTSGSGAHEEEDVPALGEREDPDGVDHEPPPGQSGPTLRVLLVEDDALVQRCVREAVERLGHEVVAVADAEAAIAAFEAHDVDVVVTDVRLPGRSGMALVRELRERRPDLSVILSTGYVHNPAPEEDDLLSDAVRLTKPYDADDLKEALIEIAGDEVPQ